MLNEINTVEDFIGAKDSLVDLCPNFNHCLFVTISPNPKVLHRVYRRVDGKRKLFKVAYSKLPQRVQYEYCMNVLRAAYNYSDGTKILGSWELNEKGDVHLHFLMYDVHIRTETQLKIFRRDVLNTPVVYDNLPPSQIDYMNNIVYVNDSIQERIDYIMKDIDNINIMPYYSNV